MIPFFQLDPATLTMWVNIDLLSEQPNPAGLSAVVDATQLGDDEKLVDSVDALPLAERPRAVAIATSMWHERRHFLDLVLTNYGAFRFRQFFEIAANLPNLYSAVVESGEKRIGLPIDLYADPIRRRRMGFDANPYLAELGAAVRSRKRMISDDRQQVPSRYGPLEIGGEAQLEALAYLHQSAKAQKLFGMEMASAALDSVPNSDAHHGKYRWIFDVAVNSEVVFLDKVAENTMLFDDSLMSCIIYASLACRLWKQPQTRSEGISSYLPPERFASLMTGLREARSGPPRIVPFDEAWALVNATCSRLFGRTIIEETEADWELAQRYFESIKDGILPALRDVMFDLQTVRHQLIQQLEDEPASVLRAAEFQEQLLPRLEPRLIYCSPRGQLNLQDGFEQVFGYDHSRAQEGFESPVAKWTWAATHADGPASEDDSAIALRDPAWMTFASELAPITKLVADGRRRRAMLGAEMIHGEGRLRTMTDADIVIDPIFATPEETFDLSSYFFLIGRDHVTCDLSSQQVNTETGEMFSKWLLINQPELAESVIQFWANGRPNDAAARLSFWRDWSPWVVAKPYSPNQGHDGFLEALKMLAAAKDHRT